MEREEQAGADGDAGQPGSPPPPPAPSRSPEQLEAAMARQLSENTEAAMAAPSLNGGRTYYTEAGPMLRTMAVRRASIESLAAVSAKAAAAGGKAAPAARRPRSASALDAPTLAAEAAGDGGAATRLVGATVRARLPEGVRAAVPALGDEAEATVRGVDAGRARALVEVPLAPGAGLEVWVPLADLDGVPLAAAAGLALEARAERAKRAPTPAVAVRPSRVPGAGAGLYAEEDVPRGETLLQVTGRVLAPRERAALRPASATHVLSFWPDASSPLRDAAGSEAGGEVSVDGRGTLWGAVNHRWAEAGNPLGAANLALAAGGQLVTRRRVHAGEELFFDYGEDYWVFQRHGVDASRQPIGVALELRAFVRAEMPNGPLLEPAGRRWHAAPGRPAAGDAATQTSAAAGDATPSRVSTERSLFLSPRHAAAAAACGRGHDDDYDLESAEQRRRMQLARNGRARGESTFDEPPPPPWWTAPKVKAAGVLLLVLGLVVMVLLFATGNS